MTGDNIIHQVNCRSLSENKSIKFERVRPIRASENFAYETQFEVSERALNMRDYVGPCFIAVYCGILI